MQTIQTPNQPGLTSEALCRLRPVLRKSIRNRHHLLRPHIFEYPGKCLLMPVDHDLKYPTLAVLLAFNNTGQLHYRATTHNCRKENPDMCAHEQVQPAVCPRPGAGSYHSLEQGRKMILR